MGEGKYFVLVVTFIPCRYDGKSIYPKLNC